MSLFTPFAFVKQEAGITPPAAGFDPTLGGTITPYLWYDFTDSATMEFSSGNNIEAIVSKGSNTGELRRGTGTKYTTNWVAPTWEGTYTQFNGSVSSNTNSTLARRYSTDGTNGSNDVVAKRDVAHTHISFIQTDWTGMTTTQVAQAVSVKSYNVTNGMDEYNPVTISNHSTLGWLFYYYSTTNQKAPSIGNFVWNGSDRFLCYSFNGVSPADSGWQSLITYQEATGNMYSLRDPDELSNNITRPNASSNTAYENIAIGSRSRNNVYGGPNFKITHTLFYDFVLSSTQMNDILASFNSAYPSLSLNSITN